VLVYNRLANTSAVTDVTSTRIYPDQIPQEDALPAITYTMTGQNNAPGTAPIYTATVRVNCFSQNHAQARTLAESADTALHGYSGISSGLHLRRLERVSYDDVYDPELDVWAVSYVYDAILTM